MPNRLAEERSLYLRQHADQPVDWWPWGAEAFAEARRRDVPVLVSIGYASCHWCHVMARECFEDPWIADLMNRHFVCVKVDREERPDVDQLHMDAVQMVQQQGGWPLNSFCLPDGRPFFGGTYFPPDERGGRTPWPRVLMRVADFFRSQREELAANADAVARNLLHFSRSPGAGAGPVGAEARLAAARALLDDADAEHGGFGGAPKFPPAMAVDFLLAVRSRPGLGEADRAAIEATARRTLDAMDRGGLRDQVGGGFHRYCVDREWTVPHFEKLLVDNALLLGAYARAAVALGEPSWNGTCAALVGWLEREMRVGPAYAASLDADTGHEEGTTYTWTPAEVAAELGEAAESWCWAHGIGEAGNFELGRSVPTFRTGASRAALAPLTERLRQARDRRPQPSRDDKVLLGWNALLATNLARAGILLDKPGWGERARDLLDHLLAEGTWRDAEGGLRLRSVLGSDIPGTLQDHAWLAEAALAVGATGDAARRAQAAEIVAAAHRRLGDPNSVGCFMAEDPEGLLPIRLKGWWDQAMPAGHSSLLATEAALEALGADTAAGGRWRALAEAYGDAARNAPQGIPRALEAIERAERGVPVLKVGPGIDRAGLLRAVGGLAPDALAIEGERPGIELCRGDTCLAAGLDLPRLLGRLRD